MCHRDEQNAECALPLAYSIPLSLIEAAEPLLFPHICVVTP